MEKKIDQSVQFILKFLNPDELAVAAQVNEDIEICFQNCRAWSIAVRREKKLRNALCFSIIRDKTSARKSWIIEKRKIIQNYRGRLCLSIFFTNDRENKNFNDRCHCFHLTPNSYTINLEGYAMTDQPSDNVLYNLYFSRTHKTKIKTFTFIRKPDTNYLHCNEMGLTLVRKLGYQVSLKLELQQYLGDTSGSTCMIVLFKKEELYDVKEILDEFTVWFPNTSIKIWGGMTDSISICQTVSRFELRKCRFEPVYTLIFIKRYGMSCYVEDFAESCNTDRMYIEQMKAFKKRVKLRYYSIGLMYISNNRVDRFFNLITEIFKELFPTVPLFPIYGDAPLHGGTLRVIMQNLPVSNYPHIFNCTSVMIITYN